MYVYRARIDWILIFNACLAKSHTIGQDIVSLCERPLKHANIKKEIRQGSSLVTDPPYANITTCQSSSILYIVVTFKLNIQFQNTFWFYGYLVQSNILSMFLLSYSNLLGVALF